MTSKHRLLSCALFFSFAVPFLRGESCCHTANAAAAVERELPGESLYHAGNVWHDQDGRELRLGDLAGSPIVITMIFSHCAFACPRTLDDLRAIQRALPESARTGVRFVLVSFDTARDTPERLRAWANEQRLGSEWTLLHGDAGAVRELAVLLQISYLPQVDGGFAHSNRIVLLDPAGVPAGAADGLGANPAPIVSAIIQLMRASSDVARIAHSISHDKSRHHND